jgi:MOSC domain-containing protein
MDRLRALYPDGRFEIRRFRPDIVSADGGDAGLREGEWIGRTVAIGGNVRLAITEPCPHRVMSTLPQAGLPGIQGSSRRLHHNAEDVGVYASVFSGGASRRSGPGTLT